ncbi:MAG: P-loop NTPase [Anaerolineae bacterium]
MTKSHHPSAENAPERPKRASDINRINCVVAVLSGKGGVGKSIVSSLLAVSLRRKGHRVGILDADITGPSIPKMFLSKGIQLDSDPLGIPPAVSRTGIKLMSINLLLPNERDAVIWRGPLIGRAIQQLWTDVIWGELDYLIVDLPPGTSDASLTVMQFLPLSGVLNADIAPQHLPTRVRLSDGQRQLCEHAPASAHATTRDATLVALSIPFEAGNLAQCNPAAIVSSSVWDNWKNRGVKKHDRATKE